MTSNWQFSVRPSMLETTALGAAMAAGRAKGIEVWNESDDHAVPVDTFKPRLKEDGLYYQRYFYGLTTRGCITTI